MTDTYSKVMLTIIAAALCVNAFQSMNIVKPAFAASDQVYKITLCDKSGRWCSDVTTGGRIKIDEK